MAEFVLTLTDAGRDLLASAMEGTAITFTAVQMGDGVASGDIRSMTALVSHTATPTISRVTRREGAVTVRSFLGLDGVQTGFLWKEVGLFAKGEGEDEDVLFAYGCVDEGFDNVPASGGQTLKEKRINLTVQVANEANINVTVDQSMAFATLDSDEMVEQTARLAANALALDGVAAGDIPTIEYGTWTPTLLNVAADASGAQNPTFTQVPYDKGSSVYVRIGNVVLISTMLYFRINNIGQGYAAIGGLPYPCALGNNQMFGLSEHCDCLQNNMATAAVGSFEAVSGRLNGSTIGLYSGSGMNNLKWKRTQTDSQYAAKLSFTTWYLAPDR